MPKSAKMCLFWLMTLFDIDGSNLDLAYQNLRIGEKEVEQEIRARLDALWQDYQPYADADFKTKFTQDIEIPFWEMYLAVQLLRQSKNLLPRCAFPKKLRDTGPDICVEEDNRRIWIEAITPGPGAEQNPDRVPPLIPINEGGSAQYAPRNKVELRISGALYDKKRKYEKYIRNGIVSPDDLCVVAVSLGKLSLHTSPYGLPEPVTAVYPVGSAQATFSAKTFDVQDVGYEQSFFISRSDKEPIERTPFLNSEYSSISGIIWSRRNPGNFFFNPHDLSFVHNFVALKSLPEGWGEWCEEYVAEECNGMVRVSPISK